MYAHTLYASLKVIKFKEFSESQYLFSHQMGRGDSESQTMGQPVSVLSNF